MSETQPQPEWKDSLALFFTALAVVTLLTGLLETVHWAHIEWYHLHHMSDVRNQWTPPNY